MSMNLMNAALEGSDDDSSSNDAPEEVAAADATDAVAEMTSTVVIPDRQSLDGLLQAADRPLVAEREEAAVSQQLPADIEMTPKKRTRNLDQESGGPKPTPPSNKKQSGCNAGRDQATKEAASEGQTRHA